MSHVSGTDRIAEVLSQRPPGLWPFLAGGYPSLRVTAGLLRGLNDLPIRGVELGIPFSDPIADGPVIQQAFTRALSGGVTLRGLFDTVAAVRDDLSYPLLAMVSASIVYRLGVGPFILQARAAGFDGLIVPDLSLEEAPALADSATRAGLALSMLIAPTTPDDRQRRIAALASGFLYYVSVQGTTGARDSLPPDLRAHVTALKEATALPVLVGFGISKPAQVREVCAYADGAIVGSTIVKETADSLDAGLEDEETVNRVIRFVGELARV